jgi:hypothetical protein
MLGYPLPSLTASGAPAALIVISESTDPVGEEGDNSIKGVDDGLSLKIVDQCPVADGKGRSIVLLDPNPILMAAGCPLALSIDNELMASRALPLSLLSNVFNQASLVTASSISI